MSLQTPLVVPPQSGCPAPPLACPGAGQEGESSSSSHSPKKGFCGVYYYYLFPHLTPQFMKLLVPA